MDADLWIKILSAILGPIVLFGGTYLTVKQARKQNSDTHSIATFDKYSERLAQRVTQAENRQDVMQKRNDELDDMYEDERRLRLAFQDYTQRTFNHFRRHPRCREEIGELAKSAKDHIDDHQFN